MTNDRPETLFVGSREVRLIPKGWRHPQDASGRYVPLLPNDMPHAGEPDQAEIAAYETTTEGTPISPAFPSTDAGRLALVNYCADHETTFGRSHADAEAWAAILFGDAAVALDGSVMAEG